MGATPSTGSANVRIASRYYRVVFQLAPDEPVFHLPVFGEYPIVTVCGRIVHEFTPYLPTKHARKIGRPCKDCFPGGDEE